MSSDERMTVISDLIGRLVACPSVNPGRERRPGPGYGEGAMAELLSDLLRTWGARTQQVEFDPGRYNMLATWSGKNPRRSVLLDAHMDTVGVEGMTITPFDPQIRDGRLYGRGACDTKGPMAAMLLAIRKILDEDGQLPVTVHFAATGDEEDGAMGAARLVESGLKVDAAIVAEPTDMKIVYAHKGACRFRVGLRGKAAHSSVPHLGVNAITAAAEMIYAIQRDFIGRLRHQTHLELGKATVCVATIRGGTKVNIVPEHCQFEVDCRCLPGERDQDLKDAMRGVLDEVSVNYPGLHTNQDVFQWYPALAGCVEDPFVARMVEANRTVKGSCDAGTAPYATDGGFFSQAGIPCIVFGPGSIAQAHTADEFIELAQVGQAVDFYAAMIRAAAP